MAHDLQQISKSRLPATTVEAMRGYARKSKSENTWRNYRTQWRQFADWCKAHGHEPLPADPEHVAAYVSERAQAGAAVASVNVTLAAIANAHQVAGHVFSRQHPTVATIIQGIRRAHAKPQAQAAPITGKMLGQVLDTCEASPSGLRDAALLALMYVFALRVSEVAGLDWSEQGAGAGWLVIHGAVAELTLVRSKGSQAEPVTVCNPSR